MVMNTEETKKAIKNGIDEALRAIIREVYEEEGDRPYGLYGYGRYCPEAYNPNNMLRLQKEGRFKEKFLKIAEGKDKIPWDEYREVFFSKPESEKTGMDALQLTPEDMEEDREFNFFDILIAENYGRAEEYLAHKEPHVQEAFIPYIEEAILLMDTLGIGEPLYYYRDKYGWNDKAFQERYVEGKGYRYVAKEDLSEQDRKALHYTALQIYYIAEDTLGYARQRFSRGIDRDLEGNDIPENFSIYYPYPFNGFSKEFLNKRFREQRAEDFKEVEDVVEYNRWACTEYYLPYLLHRMDYAIYLAFRYEGEEYRDYLSTLDFKSDFNRFYEGKTKNGEPITYERLTGKKQKQQKRK